MLMGSGGSFSKESSPLSGGGLRFGQKIYFEDGSGSGTGSNKTGRKSTSRCQVEGCRMDLSNAKAYYMKHKVCCVHSKSTKVIVSGLHQRFCQQCSRFHKLSEFDLEKRSCRRRLACHNERRRKQQPSRTLLTSSGFSRISPSLYGNTESKIVLGDSTTARSMMRVSGAWQSDPERERYHQLMNVFSTGSSSFSTTCPPVMVTNNSTDSNCALSLLSNSNSNPNQQLQMSTNLWRPSSGFYSVDKVTMALSPPAPIHNQYLNHAWEYKAGDKTDTSQHMSHVLGQSQVSVLSLHQEVMRQYIEPETTRAYGSYPQVFNWSL